MNRINIGCGSTPTCGWYNYDNSYSVRLANHPILVFIMNRIGLLDENQKKFISFVKKHNIMWSDATKRVPLPDYSVEVIYTSHMLEHLDRDEVKAFLKEAGRVLKPGGIIRIAVPDLKKIADQYNVHGDSDLFLEQTMLIRQNPKKLLDKLKYLIIGERNHQWMYDGHSLVRLLSSMGFRTPQVLPAGNTMIPDPGELDLHERKEESVYVEAHAPAT